MERKKGVVEICYQVVLIIYKKMHLWKIPVPGRDRVKTDLSHLYPGENQEERITEYYVRKLTMSLMIFFVGILLILFVVLGKSEGNSIKNGWMKRADSGSGRKSRGWKSIFLCAYSTTQKIPSGGIAKIV